MQMNVADAKAKLSEMVAAAERGEEVIIARGGHAVVRLVPVHSHGVRLGALEGLVASGSVPDFFEPMSEAELEEWGA
jgi:prevent-host-death family protein